MKELAGNLIIEDGKVLLLHRKDHDNWESHRSQGESCSTNIPEGCWGVPGGKVEEGESPTQAAVREAEEEIGVEVELRKPFYSGEFQHEGELFLWHCYLAEITEERPELKEDKFSELKWVEPSELDKVDLASNLEMIVPALRKIS